MVDSATVRVDRPLVDAGLAVLEAGGDFADGVIAFEGRRLGGTVFVSFDRTAIELIAATGGAKVMGTQVSLTYPYTWSVNHILGLSGDDNNLTLPSTISTSSAMPNLN